MKKQKKEDTLPLTFAVFAFYFESEAAHDEGAIVAWVLLKQSRRQAYVQDYSGMGRGEGAEAYC